MAKLKSKSKVATRATKAKPARKSAAKPAPGARATAAQDFTLAVHSNARRGLKINRFNGISLGGGKTDKTCVATIDYYPVQRKLFLTRLSDKIRSEGEVSADLQLHNMITEQTPAPESVAFDVPLKLPKCLKCCAHCPGFEMCKEPELEWMWAHYRKYGAKKKPPRLFTPYTERCVEQYLLTELEEPFHLPHALGSNLAPLTARAQFITRRLPFPCVEVFPKLSLWRIGNALNLGKSHLRFHRHWEGGQTSRQLILTKMMEKNLAFIYAEDVKTLVESPQAFDAFLCALTGLISSVGGCEPRPKGFPKKESWIEVPKKIFPWP